MKCSTTLLPIASLSLWMLSQLASAQSTPFAALSGPYQVGREDLVMMDETREEAFTTEPGDRRRVLVTLYYPAEVEVGSESEPYVSAEFAQLLGLPQLYVDHRASSHTGASPADGNFPVLVFSPGFGNATAFYSSLLSELASEGYVVAALWHPYSTSVVPFPEGAVRRNPEGSFEEDDDEESLGAVWVADLRFVLDELGDLNDHNVRFTGRFDLERVGAFGHSFGGATALQAAYEDERFDAALNMDGSMFGTASRAGSRVPFMFLQSDQPTPTDEQLAAAGDTRADVAAGWQRYTDEIDSVVNRSPKGSHLVLPGSRHNTFMTDLLFFAPAMAEATRANRVGTAEPLAAFTQIRTWVRDFMKTNVAGN